MALEGESAEELDRLGKENRLRAEQGLVAFMGEDGEIFYKHIDDLGPLDMNFVTTAERIEVGWLKERVERRRGEAQPPPIPHHLAEILWGSSSTR